MKHSIYNYVVENGEDYILFNTLNGSLAVLDADTYIRFISGRLSTDEIGTMYTNGFLIDSDTDEKALVDFSRASAVVSRSYRNFRILTTTACNARCSYCYESGIKTMTMTDETAQNVIKYIKNETQDADKLLITWFGGEPLVNHKVISTISKELIAYAEQKGIQYQCAMTSNGSLFTEELVQKAVTDWKLSSIQITLDGTEEYYNKAKAYVDKSDFSKVINNIKLLTSNDVYVNIRMNYNATNYDNIKELIGYLHNNLKDCRHWNMYVYPLFDNTNSSYNEDLVDKLVDLQLLIHQYSPKNPIRLPKFRPGPCLFSAVAGESILPNGDLIKCCRCMNTDKPFANVADDNIQHSGIYAKWVTPTLPEECNSCIKLPLCQGGCKAEREFGQSGCSPWMKTLDKTLINYVNTMYAK